MLSSSNRSSDAKLKLAVIGSGLAGLTIANLICSSDKYEVTLFEKEDRIGMESHSVVADIGADGDVHKWRFDVPLRGVLDTFYPHLVRMYRYFGIELVKAENAFSFSWAEPQLGLTTPFLTSSKKEVGAGFSLKFVTLPEFPDSITGLFRWIGEVYLRIRIAFEWVRLVTSALYLRRNGGFSEMEESLEEYFIRNNYSKEFSEGVIIPLFSVFCTCSLAAVRQYPARVVLDMLSGIATGNSLAAKGGVGTLCSKLAGAVDKVQLSSPVTHVLPLTTAELQDAHLPQDADRSLPWTLVQCTSDNYLFNRVIFATQANQAHQQIANPTFDLELEHIKDILAAFDYESNTVATHYDASLLPLPREHWRANNIFVPKGADEIAMDTIHLNSQCAIPNDPPVRDVFQTYSPFKPPSSDLLISQATLQRVIVTSKSSLAVDELDRIQGKAGLYFVGSYTYPCLPLLEGCVANSERLAKFLGITIPWEESHPQSPISLPIPNLIKPSLNRAYFTLPSLTSTPESRSRRTILNSSLWLLSHLMFPHALTWAAFLALFIVLVCILPLSISSLL